MSVVSLWHILYDCHACNGVEVVTLRKSLLKCSVQKNPAYTKFNDRIYCICIIFMYSVHPDSLERGKNSLKYINYIEI